MKILLEVNIEDAEIDLENYKTDTFPQGVASLEEAVEVDLDLFRRGEVALEEVIYNFGGEVNIKLVKIDNTQEVTQ